MRKTSKSPVQRPKSPKVPMRSVASMKLTSLNRSESLNYKKQEEEKNGSEETNNNNFTDSGPQSLPITSTQ